MVFFTPLAKAGEDVVRPWDAPQEIFRPTRVGPHGLKRRSTLLVRYGTQEWGSIGQGPGATGSGYWVHWRGSKSVLIGSGVIGCRQNFGGGQGFAREGTTSLGQKVDSFTGLIAPSYDADEWRIRCVK